MLWKGVFRVLNKTSNKKIWNEFSDYLKYEKKMKLNTTLSYERDLKAFFLFCKQNGASNFKDTAGIFKKYMDNIKETKSASTVSRNIASIRRFFKFLTDRKYIKEDPTTDTKYEKKIILKSDSQSEILTTDEIDRLILAVKGDSFKSLRDKAIIEMLYACGLKVSELINLKIDDLYLKDGYIRINAESLRYVPIYRGAVKAVRDYMEKGRKQVCKDRKNKFLFLNRDGKAVTRQGLWKVLKSYGEKAGIDKEITPHIIRKSMAVHLMENGAGVSDVKDILGHKNINLTKDYIRDFKPSVISAYVKAHPKA